MNSCLVIFCALWGTAVGNPNSDGTGGLPEQITFQVFVAYDDIFQANFSNQTLGTQYAAVFFNAINVIFAMMTNPRIKFEVSRLYAEEAGFTPALTLVDNEVDFNASLGSIAKFVSTRPEMNSSDIVFVFCGRKVFTKDSHGKKLYSPQGITWEGGICNDEKKVVLINDIASIFYALPYAGFQLGRLLGAPASCTPYFSRLGGRSHLFYPSNCTMHNIRNFLGD
ncbi:uncharacterized protein LOC135379070 isoform X2 [Ornithodoros turicata]|uniref:uncharacterized protein LOC135379070 isoform X2 n=1 Tax=Ornithodoros turicata TaxID=34597 RepID=UPI003139ABB1